MKWFCVLFASALAASPAVPASTVGVTMERNLARSVLQQVNSVRKEHRLPPLRYNNNLSKAAAAHTREMLQDGYFDHASADGSAFWKRLERYYGSKGFKLWSVGENLVWASPDMTPVQAIEWWMQSPEHRANLLSSQWREIGLAAGHVPVASGVYGNHEVTVVTADFGVRR